MVKFINTPAPRPGDVLRVPVGTGDVETNFVLRFPGMMDLETEGFVGVDYAMYVCFEKKVGCPAPSIAETDTLLCRWPVFRCLSAESILTICEVRCSSRLKNPEATYGPVCPLDRSIPTRTSRVLLSLPRHAQHCRGDLPVSA
jgi:hypothetical protein